jgi:P27 family predicted phage terminase small subunit
MPRRSAADLAVVRPSGGFSRLRPPADLGEDEREVWREIVGSCRSDHFEKCDVPLLVRYCENVVLARKAAAVLAADGAVVHGRINPMLTVGEKCDRALVALSMRLRISPQARIRREGTAQKGPGPSTYELMRDLDGADDD